MSTKTTIRKILIFSVIAVLLAAFAGFYAGRSIERQKAEESWQILYELNRTSIENMDGKDGTVYVIGHMSPDTDTVASSIAFARLLCMLGYDAKPMITSPVNHETAFVLEQAGAEMPGILEDASGEYIFLVDHSEYRQAAPGMEDAHIVGIMDHHGVGSVSTGQQVLYDARPIGATATIVWLNYLNFGLEIDGPTAYLLLAAILSDTANLTSSTVTTADREAVAALSKIADVSDIDALYRGLYERLLSYDGMSDEEIFFSDYKKYEAYGVTFGIAGVNAVDETAAAQLAERMEAVLPDVYPQAGMDLLYALISIRSEGKKIDYVVPGNDYSRQVFCEAFPDYDEFNGTAYIYRKGMGRKTVFVPGLTEYLGTYPRE